MDGTARADRHVDPVSIAPGDVQPPSFLDDAALDVWDRWIRPRAELGFWEPAEAPMLAAWCVAVVRLFAADKATPVSGLVEGTDQYGMPMTKKHPGLTTFLQTSNEFRQLSARLGLDPLSRMALADLARTNDGKGPQLPAGAPAAFKPKVVGE